jgi:predicted RNase H-like HicB family nuclease
MQYIEGKLIRDGRWWAVEVPLLLIYTQGSSKANAYAMVKEAIELLVNMDGFEVSIEPSGNDTFLITANEIRYLIGFMLKQNRGAQKNI